MEGDAVNQWIDAVELRKLADSLMTPAPHVAPSAPEAVYGEGFVGYAEVGGGQGGMSLAGREAAVKTLSEARGTASSAGIVYRQALPAKEVAVPKSMPLESVASRASDEMAAAEQAPKAPYSKTASPFTIKSPAPEVPRSQEQVISATPAVQEAVLAVAEKESALQVITSASSPSGQPLSRRMGVFGDWLKSSVPAEAFFVCDRNGEIISDEIGNEKLVKVARTLAHASSSASRQVGDAGGLTSPHVKIGRDRILQVIPKRSKFGLVVLGVIVPVPLRKDAIAAIAHSLSKTLGDEILIPA